MDTSIKSAAPGLLVEIKQPVAYLTLDRPDKRNALSRQLLLELETALARLAADAGTG